MAVSALKRHGIRRATLDLLFAMTLFYGYSFPVFDGMRPQFLERPIHEYRLATKDVADLVGRIAESPSEFAAQNIKRLYDLHVGRHLRIRLPK